MSAYLPSVVPSMSAYELAAIALCVIGLTAFAADQVLGLRFRRAINRKRKA